MAGVLDSARMRTFLAMELKVSVQDVSVFVLGGHGDEMVPLARYSTIGGVPLTEVLPADKIEAISKRTAGGGGELTKLIGTSAWVAPGTSAAEMVECILKDKKKSTPARSSSRVSTGSTTSSSACRSSWAPRASRNHHRESPSRPTSRRCSTNRRRRSSR